METLHQTRVLLISSGLGMVSGLVDQLGDLNYAVEAQTAHGEEALDLVARRRPDLVLLDIELGDPLEGIGLLAAAQRIHERLNVPVVFLTSSSLHPIAELVLRAHPYGYLIMPCDVRELRMVMTIALNQHQTELRLQRSEAQMQVVLRTSMDGFMVLDDTGHLRDINEAACRITGYGREELMRMHIAELDPERTQAQFAEAVEAVLRAGTVQIERKMRRKDGQIRTIEMSVTCPPGPERLLYCFGRDITGRQRAQDELIRAKEEAEKASQAKSTFLAVMSHELRTPLNVINGIAATLLEQKLDPAHRQALELSLQGGQNLLTIIEEILDFTALQAGKSSLHIAPVDLAALLHEVMGQAAALPSAKKLTLTMAVDPALPAWFQGDIRCLRQVLLNLLSNAVKFTEQGEVHLVVRPQFGATGRPGLHFSVVDTGIGIDDANRQKLFEPFTQADTSIKRRFGGTGLGLAISRSFVQLMGGELRLRSRRGVGSAFHFNVPYDPVPEMAAISEATDSAALRGKRLLLAVTVKKRRRLLGALARAWGMQVTLVDPAESAEFAALDAVPFDLALLEAEAADPGSPLRTWLDQRQVSRMVSVLWMVRPGQMAPDAAGAPARSVSLADAPAILAWKLAALLTGIPDPLAHPETVSRTAPAASLARQIPLSILAADDVQTNRQVLGLILRHLGYEVKLVENGAQVLAAVEAQPYDLLLLDVQMPVMDGLTAAREICRRFPAAAQRPRIVALTANALQGDREMCLAAGMDDYLTKPLVPATLAACIEKLFSGESPTSSSSVASFASAPPEPVWIDTGHLQMITDGLPDEQIGNVLEQMLASAWADFDQAFPQVQAACADQNAEALDRAIHGLKGCFQMLGWLQAAQGCVQALGELRAGRFVRWISFPDELHQLYQTSQREMSRQLAHRALRATQSA